VEKQGLADNPLTIGVGVTDGKPTVDRPIATVDPTQNRIVWDLGLTSILYSFPADGIAKGSGISVPPLVCTATGNFDDAVGPCLRSSSFGGTISCARKAPVPGTCYKYDVKVTPRLGGSTTPRDPWIKSN
jgi:hypothetical protein